MRLTLDASLPIVQRDEWDGDAVRERIFAWGAWESESPRYDDIARLFLFTRETGTRKDDYVAPCGDIVDGEPVLVTSGMRYALAAVNGARGGIDAPAEMLDEARALLARLLGRVDVDAKSASCAEFKVLPDGTPILKGYAIVWGGRDLEGDTFPPDVDLGEGLLVGTALPVLYEHGQHPEIGVAILGRVKSQQRDNIGWLIEAELDRSNRYIELLRRLAEEGRLGLSTGAVAHLVERTPQRSIKRWVVAEVSATPTPAEPRTLGAEVVKALGILQEAELDGGDEAAPAAARDGATTDALREEQANLKSEVGMYTTTTTADVSVALGDWMKTVAYARTGQYSDATKNITITPGTAGGYLIPEQHVPDLYQFGGLLAEVWRRCALITPIGSPINIPMPNMATNPSGGWAVYGGAVAGFFGESATITQSTMAFKQVALTPRTLAARARASWAITHLGGRALETTVFRHLTGAWEYALEAAILTGTGTGQPVGVAAAANTGRYLESRATAGTVSLADLAEMYARQMSPQTAIWVCHPSVLPALLQLSASNVIAWNRDVATAPPATIYGRPLFTSPALSVLGSAGDIIFCDFSMYALALSDPELDATAAESFSDGMITYRLISLCDGRPLVDAVVPSPVGTYDRSYYVVLDA